MVKGVYLRESVRDAFGLACGFEQARCRGDEDEEEHWGEYTALCDSGAEFDLGPRSLWGREIDACVCKAILGDQHLGCQRLSLVPRGMLATLS